METLFSLFERRIEVNIGQIRGSDQPLSGVDPVVVLRICKKISNSSRMRRKDRPPQGLGIAGLPRLRRGQFWVLIVMNRNQGFVTQMF
jgi:hypothetical protein